MADRPDVLLVSHTHWDREWYRTFEAFRARLVDTVDRVLALLDEDPGWKFLLDGQAIVIEDYLLVRPHRRADLAEAIASGRLAVGPWYVQPDSLLPSGEAHVRNLLEGRRVASQLGRVSEVAYTPDSFGHPGQFPQLFAGFGLGPFVYWRGNGNELDELGPIYTWQASDGSEVTAYHLGRGYFAAANLNPDAERAAKAVEGVLERIGDVPGAPVVLMNGIDHALPDAHTAAVAEAITARTGRRIARGVLDELRDEIDLADRRVFRGELVGGRIANLLPGVWSTHLDLKLRNRAAEGGLEGWAEPWTAIGLALGLPNEHPSVRAAWRALLPNQAHDSICGCSQDRVHQQMQARYDTAIELGEQTTARVLERLAGLGEERKTPWNTELDYAVFNPSPFPRTEIVRIALDGVPVFRMSDMEQDVHPMALVGGSVQGYTADGAPARVIISDDPGRVRLLDAWPPVDVELVVADIPAYGYKRVHLAPSEEHSDVVDDGRKIVAGEVSVAAADDGTLTVRLGGTTFTGLCGLEDVGDRGDTYDFDPVAEDSPAPIESVSIERAVHPSGIQQLQITRVLAVPAALDAAHRGRSDVTVPVTVTTVARVVPGIERVDLHVEVDNPADDHRLRLLFPTGAPVETFAAATTFDVASRTTEPPDASGWEHPAPQTFPQQGFVAANGLAVVAPGLPEAEVTKDGVIAITVVRAVGWLARMDLTTRPVPAGPGLPTPDAQCHFGISADLSLRLADDPGLAAHARADELGVRAVAAGDTPIVQPGTSLVGLVPASLVLSALKPAEDDDGIIVRVLNPTDTPIDGELRVDLPVRTARGVRLDETDDGGDVMFEDRTVRLTVGAHQLRSVRLR
ncbi:MAG TPA: glycosyl hydrolase-related protein [Acidimicrobiia bacterium]|jgi:alpha-mannosidase